MSDGKNPPVGTPDDVIERMTHTWSTVRIAKTLVEGVSVLLGAASVSCYCWRVEGDYECLTWVGEMGLPETIPATDPLVHALAAQRGPISRTVAAPEVQATMSALHSDLAIPLWGCERLLAFITAGQPQGRGGLHEEQLASLQRVFDQGALRLECAWLQEQRLIYSRATAHDLHQPLKGYPSEFTLLRYNKAEPLTPRQAKILERLKRLLDRLNEGFERLFSFYPFYEAVLRGERDWGNVDLTGVCQSLADQFRPQVEEKRLGFQVRLPPTPCWVRGDPQGLRLALYHVLHNACRYTQQGEVTLTLESQDHRHRLVVTDTGPGIPPERLQDLWRPFIPLWPERTHLPGMGLAYVFAVLQDHHGDVQMKSQVGQGTTCTLTLPQLLLNELERMNEGSL